MHHRSRPLSLIYDIIPYALVAVQGCPYHDKLLFCYLSLVTLYPTPHLPLAATRSIAWSVCIPVSYINPNTLPKELQLSSLGYLPSLRDCPTGDTNVPSRHSRYTPPFHYLHSRPSSGPIASGLASWLHHSEMRQWIPCKS